MTASRRLARLLAREYNARQVAHGKLAWRTPVIVAWPDWLTKLQASAGPGNRAARLNGHQSRVLWERILNEVIDDSLVNIPSLTRHARDAWKRLHEWRVPFDECVAAASSRDQRVFAAAASRYRDLLAAERWIDEAMLASEVAAAVREGILDLPGRLLLAGFDRLTPEADLLVDALRARGVAVERSPSLRPAREASVFACEDPDAELRSAGAWAHAQLAANPGDRVGIVVTGLEQDAARAGRLVREGMVPGWQYGPAAQRTALNVSFGRRLGDYPAIEIALLLLRWSHGGLSGKDLSVLLRTPFLGTESNAARARLELELRRIPDRSWSPERLLRVFGERATADDAADWLARLGKLRELRRQPGREASPAQWAAVVDTLLEDFGWPGAAPLESADFQLVNRWRDLLNDFARLDLVAPRMTLANAVGQLSAMAADTVFQPEMDGAAVEVLGPLEAAGVEFDRLWIAGLSASRWPPAGRPTALISRRLQRHYGMPDADPDDTAAYAKRVIDRLQGSARACTCSYPRQSGDAVETVSALLAGIAAGDAPPDPGWHAAQLCGLAEPKPLASDPVPPVRPDEAVAGGAAILQWQRDEPFSAFALGRLGIATLWPIVPGLSPALRGNLIHAAAFRLYGERPSQADIRGWLGTELERRTAAAVQAAFPRYERHADSVLRELFALERQRVERLCHELVAADLQREPFSVHAVEQASEIVMAGVRLGLRIDRIDRLDDGGVAILDYKTGSRRKFLDGSGEPADSQLVVYAIAAAEPVAALGFYNVDSRGTALDASGRDAMGAAAWQEALERWSR
ncbi:MAG TPA: PD-(D/E)XK nuclease family protein, partial [Pelomicrobium sp.]|nr:PD-(D/E)XK nuclease family protein [Pelomicrobium sp.]